MTAVSHKEFSALSSVERQALLTLLEDEDTAVQQLLVDQLVSYGPSALEWLRPLLPGRSGIVRRRVELVENQLKKRDYDHAFLEFCLSSDVESDLEGGLWLLAQSEYPSISVPGYQALVDSFAEVLREQLEGVEDGEGTFSVINHYLFEELGLEGNEDDYYDPRNSFLNKVIDRRLGIPISMSALLLLIASRLGLPLTGIGMPGHFLCRYQTPREEFYVDVFNQGRILSRTECVRFLSGSKFGYRDEFLTPVSPRSILLRFCRNLLHIYTENQEGEQAARFQRYVSALSRLR